MDLGDVGSGLLEGPQAATKLVSQALDAVGEGVEWTGDQIQELAALVAQLSDKLGELQAKARGDEPGA